MEQYEIVCKYADIKVKEVLTWLHQAFFIT